MASTTPCDARIEPPNLSGKVDPRLFRQSGIPLVINRTTTRCPLLGASGHASPVAPGLTRCPASVRSLLRPGGSGIPVQARGDDRAVSRGETLVDTVKSIFLHAGSRGIPCGVTPISASRRSDAPTVSIASRHCSRTARLHIRCKVTVFPLHGVNCVNTRRTNRYLVEWKPLPRMGSFTPTAGCRPGRSVRAIRAFGPGAIRARASSAAEAPPRTVAVTCRTGR